MGSAKRLLCGALCVVAALALAGRASAGYMDVILGDSPVAYYRLGETASPVANSGTGGAALNGTLMGFVGSDLGQPGPRPAGYLGFEATNLAPRFNYNGSSERVEVGDNAALDITGALSLEAWVRLDGPTTTINQGIIAKYRSQTGSTNQRAYQLFIDNQTAPAGQGSAAMVVSDDGTFTGHTSSVLGTTNLNDGLWHHVVATYDPSTYMRIYVDGKLQSATTTGVMGSIENTAAPLWLGCQFDSSNAAYYLDGSIDEGAVYSYLLDDPDGNGSSSDSRILAHYVAAFTPSAAPTASEVLYREVFPNGTGANQAPSHAGWNAHYGSGAVAFTTSVGVSGLDGRPNDLPAINSFPASAEQVNGLFSDYNGSIGNSARMFWASEFPIDLSVYALEQAQWYQGNADVRDAFRVAVQLDGAQWYASDMSFTNPGIAGADFDTDAELKTFGFEGAEWYLLNFTPGSLLEFVGSGSPFGLPEGSFLTSFGLFSETRLGTLRFDSFELIVGPAFVIPEPSTLAVGLLGLLVCRLRRARARRRKA
ncbi:MAG TPA: LamG domain-containing protein [Planctomycetota bacterium]|nr:LamG domain-containing protein [Planctomycetota bacterium]